jgi:hypothetical protein
MDRDRFIRRNRVMTEAWKRGLLCSDLAAQGGEVARDR